MKISVIIPTLNEKGNIVEVVHSALAAGAEEVIVVDGGSTDGTVEIAIQLGCFVLASSPGRALQQNLGALRASGDILIFLHADCRLHPESLSSVTTTLSHNGVAGGAFEQRIDASGFIYWLIERGNALRVKWFGVAYGDQAIFVRRQLFDEIGGFPNSRLMEDVLFVRKLKMYGRIVLVSGPLTVSARRWQRHGIIRQTLRNWLIILAERIGVSPNYLARYYPSCSESPKSSVVTDAIRRDQGHV